MVDHWLNDPENARLTTEVRERIGEGTGRVFIFLGAGLSFGVDRGRVLFEFDKYDDGMRFPSWPLLIKRMHQRMRNLPEFQESVEWVDNFFDEQNAIDCAELFRYRVGEANYFDFLRQQFETKPSDRDLLTPSHHELVKLPVDTLFTTNFDELIELSYHASGQEIRVSSTPAEFVSDRQQQDAVRLLKLNGSIHRPDTTVLCRMDFAKARKERAEMLNHLAHELRSCVFLFVGFSLADPNFAIIHDEARLATNDDLPLRYVVQGKRDPVKEAYLRSMGVNTISLDLWESLPQLFSAINPLVEPLN